MKNINFIFTLCGAAALLAGCNNYSDSLLVTSARKDAITDTPEVTEPLPSPTVSAKPSPIPSPTVSPQPSPTPSSTIAPKPSPTPSPTVSPKPSPVPSLTPSPTPTVVTGKTYFVSPSGSDSNPGTSLLAPLRTIAAAGNKALPGDTIFLLPGNYSESIVPLRSGVVGKPITYASYGPTPAVLTSPSANSSNRCGPNVAIGMAFSGVSHIVVSGINIDGGVYVPNARFNSFACFYNSTNIIIRKGDFRYANGWAGLDFQGASYITIEDNTFDFMGGLSFKLAPVDGVTGDNVTMSWGPVSSHNLIQRNKFYHPPHDHISIMTGTHNVIQDNYFNGSWRDLTGTNNGYRSMHVFGSDNLVQRNYFEYSGDNTSIAGFRGTHAPIVNIGGIRTIFRNNVVARAEADAIMTEFASWTPNVVQLRIYNNTIYKANGFAWSLQAYDGGKQLSGIMLKNNFMVDARRAPWNGAIDYDVAFDFFYSAGPTLYGDTGTTQVVNNFISPALGKTPMLYIYQLALRMDIPTAQSRYPSLISGNVAARPLFTIADPLLWNDFKLRAGSPGIDQGAFLTRVVGSGTSNTIRVADSSYFSDGNGLVAGDVVQLKGSTAKLQVIAIDRTTNTLTLSTSVSFTDGQEIGLAYNGSAPDVGAFESP